MTVVTTADTSQLYALAARHGLKLHGPLTVNELGLDYRIVIATVDDGRRWVLRIPRRAEVSAKVEPEARVLAMLKNRLPFAVPDWRVANAELVAYPMLEDSTAMVIQPGSSTPDWVVPQDSEVFAESFATALAALHAVPISAAVDAGMLIRTPTQARQKVADDVDRVRREFVVNDKRLHRWQRWLDDDSSWPDFSVVVPAYGRALALLKREGRCPSDVEHRQIKYRNNVIECDHGKLKRIINATLGFKSMKTAYATIKGIEVMRALRKGQASAFYYGDPLGEMRLVSRVFEM
nr:DDE-type integrase/transposase/recombinase [Escherichia coli]